MPKYWMITNREIKDGGFGHELAQKRSYWISDEGSLDDFNKWKQVTEAEFKDALIEAANKLPLILSPERHAAAARFVDTLGPSDRVGLWALPVAPTSLRFLHDREQLKRELLNLVGTRPPGVLLAGATWRGLRSGRGRPASRRAVSR